MEQLKPLTITQITKMEDAGFTLKVEGGCVQIATVEHDGKKKVLQKLTKPTLVRRCLQ